MKKLLLFVAALGFALTGCEKNDDAPNTVLTSEVKVDGVDFKPSQNGASTYFTAGGADTNDQRHFSLIKGNGTNIFQAIYVTLELRDGQSNDGGDYIFEMGETATNLFANGVYVEGDMAWQLAAGTVHVTEMTDGYYKLVFDNVQALNGFNPGGTERLITGEFKAKFTVIDPLVD
ncbi:hypothetical protein AAEO56_03385 [Flavobacterium sp. DGU11]|uniref:Lipoprotein n=1 Tax=Flavobacterium arundinis TaxID=3139143 RepID=A0ABU9HTI0_9FLAO